MNPEQTPEQTANRQRTARQLEYAINRMAGRYADAVSASLLATSASEVTKQTRARFRRHSALLRLTRALANLAVGA